MTVDTDPLATTTPAIAAEVVDAADHLTPKQAAFVLEFFKDRSASDAARRAGYSASSREVLAQTGSRLLRHPAVAAVIREIEEARLEEICHRVGVTLAHTLVSLARTAFADPRKLFDANGAPLPIQELDDDTALAIESVEVVETYAGTGEDREFTGYIKRYRFSKRSAAQDMLMRHLNGYAADHRGKGEASVSALTSLLDGMRRSALPVIQEVEDETGV